MLISSASSPWGTGLWGQRSYKGQSPDKLCRSYVQSRKLSSISDRGPTDRISNWEDNPTVARRLRIDVHDNNDNAWQRGPLSPHGMGPMTSDRQRSSDCLDNGPTPASATMAGTPQTEAATGPKNNVERPSLAEPPLAPLDLRWGRMSRTGPSRDRLTVMLTTRTTTDRYYYYYSRRHQTVNDPSLFHRRTHASYVYNVCLAWYNVVLTHGSTQAWNS